MRNAEIGLFKTGHVEFQLKKTTNSATSNSTVAGTGNNNNYHAFQLLLPSPLDGHATTWDTLQRYVDARVLVAPFKASNVLAYLNMLAIGDLKLLKEMTQLLECEMVCSLLIMCTSSLDVFHFCGC